jgi:hypothetical protein
MKQRVMYEKDDDQKYPDPFRLPMAVGEPNNAPTAGFSGPTTHNSGAP